MIATSTQNCEFSNPVIIDRSGNLIPALNTAQFQFSKLNCTSTYAYEIAGDPGNPTSTENIYYEGFSSGEVVLTVFVFLIFLLLLFGSILKPFWARQL